MLCYDSATTTHILHFPFRDDKSIIACSLFDEHKERKKFRKKFLAQAPEQNRRHRQKVFTTFLSTLIAQRVFTFAANISYKVWRRWWELQSIRNICCQTQEQRNRPRCVHLHDVGWHWFEITQLTWLWFSSALLCCRRTRATLNARKENMHIFKMCMTLIVTEMI